MKKCAILITLFILLVSCSSEKSDTVIKAEHTIVVDEKLFNTKRKASDIISTMTIVPLETSDESLVGNIDKIVPKGDTLFFQDNLGKSILLFDRRGKFLNKIRRYGQGPGEYLTLDDFTVTRSGKIIILDGEFRKLIFLDEKGEYLSQQKIPIYVNALECIDDTLIVFNGASTNDRVIIWDFHKEKVVSSHIRYDRRYSTKILKPLIKYGDIIYFQRAKSSVIYKVTTENLEEKWFIDFGKRNINLKNLEQVYPIGNYVAPDYYIEMNRFIESDKYILFDFRCNELSDYNFFMYYSKTTGTQICFNNNRFQDDKFFLKYMYFARAVSATNEFVSCMPPQYVLEGVSSYNPKDMKLEELERYNDLKRQIQNINEFDNHVIVFFTLNDF